MKLHSETWKSLIEISKTKQLFLEGNITKLIDGESNPEYLEYLNTAIEKDKENRRKRLDVTKQIQSSNKELTLAQAENDNLMRELKEALEKAEKAKIVAEQDLDLLQKKTQTELIGTIVKVALFIIIGVGASTTVLYSVVLLTGGENKIVESTWSNMFSILLTNSFSIIGTIMGIKYASSSDK